ncbi:DUF1697 domain-containing protein [Andreprevotia chitinilytica]|uniref:DUF1697 domain-containing protein n=1 Tax=Andreprevotia chitinilytica TaxID=396808 RepID=UPI00055064FE|nr:DUF1697 domain-containing protein [Andreprevotia chitinilytica]
MSRQIAFLRAINVGGRTVKMERLRQIFEAMGFANVETFIASGNVIFDAEPNDGLALQIEAGLKQALGFEVATFVRSAAALAAIVARQSAFGELPEQAGLYIGFAAAPVSAQAQQKLAAFGSPVDEFQFEGTEIYWLCRDRFSDSMFSGPLLEKTIGMPLTVRNSTTVRKIAAKYPA